ncbi:hypothetical protein IMCC3088_1903 [Aequoribacter fuscus]|uniref:Uncharacterized protein n=1 Tax=Aequoribacter fuscus TaxID=2518989 RepID=F3L2X9_9GAMM|nr:hypothetical protein IMCC3088_1903 [Aequoribacter fuscus]
MALKSCCQLLEAVMLAAKHARKAITLKCLLGLQIKSAMVFRI